MPLSSPIIEQRGSVFELRWPQDGVHIRISRIYQSPRGEMHGEISVLYQPDLPINGSYGPRLVTESRYQLTSKRSRSEIAKHCDSESPGLEWSEFVETASLIALRRSRRGADVLDLSEWTPPPDIVTGYRLTPLLAEGHPNMIFGDGGVGKSMIALWLATMVTEGMQTPFECMSGNVLYLDWEMDAADAHGRLSMIADGMGLPGPPRLFYRRCAGRLVDDVERLSETVASKDIDLVIVDSAVPACGGNPNEPESVQTLFYGLRQLEVTSMDPGPREQGQRERRRAQQPVWERVLVQPQPQRVAGAQGAGDRGGLYRGDAVAQKDQRGRAAGSGDAQDHVRPLLLGGEGVDG